LNGVVVLVSRGRERGGEGGGGALLLSAPLTPPQDALRARHLKHNRWCGGGVLARHDMSFHWRRHQKKYVWLRVNDLL
jgi:hypothetical protein